MNIKFKKRIYSEILIFCHFWSFDCCILKVVIQIHAEIEYKILIILIVNNTFILI